MRVITRRDILWTGKLLGRSGPDFQLLHCQNDIVTSTKRKQLWFVTASCWKQTPQNYRRRILVRRTDPKGQVRSDCRLHRPMARCLAVSALESATEAVQCSACCFSVCGVECGVGWLLTLLPF